MIIQFKIFIFLLFSISSVFSLSKTVHIKARDGTSLKTDIYYEPLQLNKKNPVVFMRTPYNALSFKKIAHRIMEKYLDKFIIVAQDVRGFYGSSGEFGFFRDSAFDGADSISWIVSQKWSNGKIYTIGGSANAIVQYAMVQGKVVNVFGQCPFVGTAVLHQASFQGGAFRNSLWTSWLIGVKKSYLEKELYMNEGYSDWWANVDMRNNTDNIKWPSIHIGGWFDIFSEESIKGFQFYRKNNPDTTYLIMNSGGHCSHPVNINFKDGQKYTGSTLDDICLEMFTGKVPMPHKITMYVLNLGKNSTSNDLVGNVWVGMDDFPKVNFTKYYFTKDGTLSKSQPEDETEMKFLYDPNDPVPTKGGRNLFLPCGPEILNEIEKRNDTLVFTTEPLKDNLALVGTISVHLKVSSNCSDTDFVCRISDVYEDGRSFLLSDGILRMKWRESDTDPVLMKKFEVYEVDVNLWNIAAVISPGHRVRVACTSSNHPRFLVNGNSGKLIIDEKKNDYITAENSIYIKESYLSLPVVSPSQIFGQKK